MYVLPVARARARLCVCVRVRVCGEKYIATLRRRRRGDGRAVSRADGC